jgi:hypothetical protein
MLGITYTIDETVVVEGKVEHAGNTVVGMTERMDTPCTSTMNNSHSQGVITTPFSMTRSTVFMETDLGSRMRLPRHRGNQQSLQSGGDPCLPLPDTDAMRNACREKVADGVSTMTSYHGSEGASRKRYHFRSKRNSITTSPPQPPSLPQNGEEEEEEDRFSYTEKLHQYSLPSSSEGGSSKDGPRSDDLARYKEDDEIDPLGRISGC